VSYFQEFMEQHRQGGMLTDLSEKLEDAVADAMRSGKEATITIVIAVKPKGTDRVFVSDKITAKQPQPEHSASLFFVTPQNRLTRKNPNQLALSDFNREE
jgi:hypothetical protein